MKLEQQVVSLELAKRLKELGVKQESLFYWVEDPSNYHEPIVKYENRMNDPECYSAFTVAELREMLPTGIAGEGSISGTALQIGRTRKKQWFCGYCFHWANPVRGMAIETVWRHCEESDTEADARGKMLIYLIENNLLSTKE